MYWDEIPKDIVAQLYMVVQEEEKDG